jgi:hypothetical protein
VQVWRDLGHGPWLLLLALSFAHCLPSAATSVFLTPLSPLLLLLHCLILLNPPSFCFLCFSVPKQIPGFRMLESH